MLRGSGISVRNALRAYSFAARSCSPTRPEYPTGRVASRLAAWSYSHAARAKKSSRVASCPNGTPLSGLVFGCSIYSSWYSSLRQNFRFGDDFGAAHLLSSQHLDDCVRDAFTHDAQSCMTVDGADDDALNVLRVLGT